MFELLETIILVSFLILFLLCGLYEEKFRSLSNFRSFKARLGLIPLEFLTLEGFKCIFEDSRLPGFEAIVYNSLNRLLIIQGQSKY